MVMNRERATQSRQSGFTLIEVMVVVIIFGVLSALAAPSFQKAYDKKARSYAVSNKAPFGVHFDNEGRVVTVFANTSNPSATSFESTDSVYASDTLSPDFPYVYANFENSALVFQPNGSAVSTGGSNIVLVGETSQMMAYFSISVLASTGRVSSHSTFYDW
jgi:prepilin-type N-terminal cleavage/methylation domain-containing protein